jgi:trimeric autotransporter adhesin
MPGAASLHWRFDEDAGNVALDASGMGNAGTYVGEPTAPTPSNLVPATMFANPRSRLFGATGRPSVRLANVPAALKPANEMTFTLFYRATTVAMGGTDLLNLGTDFLLRLKPADIEFAKRVSTVAGMVYGITRAAPISNHVDGKWHHVAGVATAAGMRIYVDGTLRGSNARGEPAVYTSPDLWIGRNGDGTPGRDFAGNVDEVRIYTRALAAEEIAALAAGGP